MKEQASNSTQGWQGMYLWDETARTLAWIGGLDMRTGRLILHYVDSDTLIPTGDAGFIDRMEMMARWGTGYWHSITLTIRSFMREKSLSISSFCLLAPHRLQYGCVNGSGLERDRPPSDIDVACRVPR